jgi:hypothetical protein
MWRPRPFCALVCPSISVLLSVTYCQRLKHVSYFMQFSAVILYENLSVSLSFVPVDQCQLHLTYGRIQTCVVTFCAPWPILTKCSILRSHSVVEHTKNTDHQQMHKESFIINRNTLLHVSTLLGHLQGELFCYRYTRVALYSWVTMCCWLCTVYWRRELSAVPITKSSPGRWPSRVETRRSVLQFMIKLSLCICWWFVFLQK